MLGAGLGRTILYMRGVRDGVIDHFAGSGVPGPLKESDTVVGMWPAVVGGIVFAVIAFVFAVIPRRQRQGAAKPMIGIGIAASIGLFGIVLVECGWVPISFVLLLVALFMAWAVLPSEVAIARQCASKRSNRSGCGIPPNSSGSRLCSYSLPSWLPSQESDMAGEAYRAHAQRTISKRALV